MCAWVIRPASPLPILARRCSHVRVGDPAEIAEYLSQNVLFPRARGCSDQRVGVGGAMVIVPMYAWVIRMPKTSRPIF